MAKRKSTKEGHAAHCIACLSFVLFLLAIVLHVRLLYFFSWPLYCMSVFCTISLAHCIACPAREKVQKTDMQYNGQEKKYKRRTCNTMAKRKGAKDRHAIQWPREKVQKTDMQYNGQEKYVRLLHHFSWPLYCMSVYCTISLGHCIACPSIAPFLLAIVTMAKRKGAKDRHAIQWPREKVQKTDMQYNGQEKRCKRQTCNTMGKRNGAIDEHAIQWPREMVQ
jgi:hypothetical protein